MAIEKVLGKRVISYKVRIYKNQKVEKYSTFRRKVDAEKWESQQKYLMEQEKNFPTAVKDTTVDELFGSWLEDHCNDRNEPSTVVRKKQIYKDFVKDSIGSRKAADVLPDQIDLIIKRIIKTKMYSNKSINNILEVLKALFYYGIKKRHIIYNPMTSIEMLPTDEHGYKFWSKEEVSQFLAYTKAKYNDSTVNFYIFYVAALNTGMRLGELLGLKWTQVDFANRLITVSKSFDKTTKKVKNTTKGHNTRFIGINDCLLAELKELRSKRPDSIFVVENATGKHFDSDSFRKRNFKQDIKGAKVSPIRIHDMRHTYASHFMMKGGNLYDLQQILGHSDIKTTMVYAHLAPSHMAHKANIVNFETDKKE